MLNLVQVSTVTGQSWVVFSKLGGSRIMETGSAEQTNQSEHKRSPKDSLVHFGEHNHRANFTELASWNNRDTDRLVGPVVLLEDFLGTVFASVCEQHDHFVAVGPRHIRHLQGRKRRRRSRGSESRKTREVAVLCHHHQHDPHSNTQHYTQ